LSEARGLRKNNASAETKRKSIAAAVEHPKYNGKNKRRKAGDLRGSLWRQHQENGPTGTKDKNKSKRLKHSAPHTTSVDTRMSEGAVLQEKPEKRKDKGKKVHIQKVRMGRKQPSEETDQGKKSNHPDVTDHPQYPAGRRKGKKREKKSNKKKKHPARNERDGPQMRTLGDSR